MRMFPVTYKKLSLIALITDFKWTRSALSLLLLLLLCSGLTSPQLVRNGKPQTWMKSGSRQHVSLIDETVQFIPILFFNRTSGESWRSKATPSGAPPNRPKSLQTLTIAVFSLEAPLTDSLDKELTPSATLCCYTPPSDACEEIGISSINFQLQPSQCSSVVHAKEGIMQGIVVNPHSSNCWIRQCRKSVLEPSTHWIDSPCQHPNRFSRLCIKRQRDEADPPDYRARLYCHSRRAYRQVQRLRC